jgi:hypothetical protein
LLYAFFRPRLATTPLRFANPSPPSGWIEDFHLQAVDHPRHTATGSRECAPDDGLRDTHRFSSKKTMGFAKSSTAPTNCPALPDRMLTVERRVEAHLRDGDAGSEQQGVERCDGSPSTAM